jgi:hypothetical protein
MILSGLDCGCNGEVKIQKLEEKRIVGIDQILLFSRGVNYILPRSTITSLYF